MRCNVGVNPIYLADQHLIAEVIEIPMVVGSLRKWGWQIKSKIPDVFNLGAGHMNFLKNKLKYLARRHEVVKDEVFRRGFHYRGPEIIVEDYPIQFCNDWQPSIEDSKKIRERILWKLSSENTRNHEVDFWRYERKNLNMISMDQLRINILNGELYPV